MLLLNKTTVAFMNNLSGWLSNLEVTGRDQSTGCTPIIFRFKYLMYSKKVHLKNLNLKFLDWRKLLSSNDKLPRE